jgi:hypothetical protein
MKTIGEVRKPARPATKKPRRPVRNDAALFEKQRIASHDTTAALPNDYCIKF